MSELRFDGLDGFDGLERSDVMDRVDGLNRADRLDRVAGPDASDGLGGSEGPRGASEVSGGSAGPGGSAKPGGSVEASASSSGERSGDPGPGRLSGEPGVKGSPGLKPLLDAMTPGDLLASPDLVGLPDPSLRRGDHDPAPAAPKSAPRRGAVDPVKALMHRHRDLCERAVDPLEIAAGLEAHGVTDRTAARFRHRDVFSLAEEMYARVSARRGGRPRERRAGAGRARRTRPAGPCSPCCRAPSARRPSSELRLTDGQARLVTARPRRPRGGTRPPCGSRAGAHCASRRDTAGRTRAWACWLIAYALLGDGLLAAGLDGGPHGLWPLAVAPVLALALACAPAAWCAHLFVRTRPPQTRRQPRPGGVRRLRTTPAPRCVRPLPLCPGRPARAVRRGPGRVRRRTPARVPSAPCSSSPVCSPPTASPRPRPSPSAQPPLAEALALATVFASRLPGCSFLAVPCGPSPTPGGPGPSPPSPAAPPRSPCSSTPPAR